MSTELHNSGNLPAIIKKTRGLSSVVAERVNIVMGWLLECYPSHKIHKMGSEQWNVSERQVDYYIDKAKELIYIPRAEGRSNQLEKALKQWEQMYNKAIDDGHQQVAVVALRNLHELQTLYLKQIDVTSNGKTMPVITINIVDPEK